MQMNRLQLAIFHQVEPYFTLSIENGLKGLLETKHLYQNLRINPPDRDILQQELTRYFSGGGSRPGSSDTADIIEPVCNSLANIEWTIKNLGVPKTLPLGVDSPVVYVSVDFTPPTVKLFCRTCKRIEAYNFQYGQDLLSEFRDAEKFTKSVNEQVFSIAYQCQSCKSIPEIFIVRRDGLKLVQSGRTPMEEIEIPSFLPKKQKRYFSDAIVAFNSGQILAGNFLLRTFIEQYVRSLSSTPDSQNIDLLFSEYNKDLPDDFKQRFLSLQSVYNKLSDDLHLAAASEDVFIESRDNILKHFKARELYEL